MNNQNNSLKSTKIYRFGYHEMNEWNRRNLMNFERSLSVLIILLSYIENNMIHQNSSALNKL